MKEIWLTPKELVERLRLRSSELVDDLYALTTRQLDTEDKREASLTTKAVSLLSASGVSVSFALGFTTLLAGRLDYFHRMSVCGRSAVMALYFVAVLTAVVAGLLAVAAMLVRTTYVAINEDDVFGDELNSSDEQGPKPGQDHYRRYLIAHLWRIYQHTFDVHETKAKTIRLGQCFYGLFLILLVPLGATLAYLMARS